MAFEPPLFCLERLLTVGRLFCYHERKRSPAVLAQICHPEGDVLGTKTKSEGSEAARECKKTTQCVVFPRACPSRSERWIAKQDGRVLASPCRGGVTKGDGEVPHHFGIAETSLAESELHFPKGNFTCAERKLHSYCHPERYTQYSKTVPCIEGSPCWSLLPFSLWQG